MEKNDFENRLLAGDIAMLWQGRMSQGPKFLLECSDFDEILHGGTS